MARMHARRRGKAQSKRPGRETAPDWQPIKMQEITETIVKLARDGNTGAKIGLILRDQYGVPDVRLATGKRMARILAENDVKPDIPEDLTNLMKTSVKLQSHLAEHRKDLHNKRGLQLIESKIRRLSKYYRTQGVLPANWKYSPATARLLVGE